MLAEERKNFICNIINEKKAVRVSELSKELQITEATVRRDLDELQNEKKIRRTHGGAVALYPAGINYVISELSVERIEEKRLIAQKAYEYVDDLDTILMDGSSTVLELCKLIAAGNKKGLTVLTNAFSVVNVLAKRKDITVVHVGGVVKYEIDSSVGNIAENTIRNLRVDKTFLGVNGVEVGYGYSITNFAEAAVKVEMIQSAKQVFVLADHSKFSVSYLAKIADFEGKVDYLITDKRRKSMDYTPYEENVNYIVADDGESVEKK